MVLVVKIIVTALSLRDSPGGPPMCPGPSLAPSIVEQWDTGNVLLPSYTPLRPIASPYHCLPTAWSLTEPLFPLTRRT